MPKGERYLTDAQLTTIGRRYNCDEVGAEAVEAAGRWRRDLKALASYGHGDTALAEFEADMAEHARLRSGRPEVVTDKRAAVIARDKQVSRAWAWVDQVKAVLGRQARKDQTLALALDEATPTDDAGLETGLRALASLLAETKPKLPPEVAADNRLAEVNDLCAALHSSPVTVQTSKSHTRAETAQIDLYDGKLYQQIRDLNRAGRAAIRNGDLAASLHEYALRRLKRSGNPAPAPQPQPVPAALVPSPSAT
jgi:hypothetical protein